MERKSIKCDGCQFEESFCYEIDYPSCCYEIDYPSWWTKIKIEAERDAEKDSREIDLCYSCFNARPVEITKQICNLIFQKYQYKMNWTPFWFEGNLAFGLIESREQWEDVKNTYKRDAPTIDPLTAKHDIRKSKHYPCFGFYAEYKDNPTLGEWAKEHDMKL